MSWLEQNPLIDYVKQQALQQGLQQGREEEKREVALRLLEMGLPLATILQATGLSTESLEVLRKPSVAPPPPDAKES